MDGGSAPAADLASGPLLGGIDTQRRKTCVQRLFCCFSGDTQASVQTPEAPQASVQTPVVQDGSLVGGGSGEISGIEMTPHTSDCGSSPAHSRVGSIFPAEIDSLEEPCQTTREPETPAVEVAELRSRLRDDLMRLEGAGTLEAALTDAHPRSVVESLRLRLQGDLAAWHSIACGDTRSCTAAFPAIVEPLHQNMADLEAQFEAAQKIVKDGKPTKGSASNGDKLRLYQYYKQATVGDNTEDQPSRIKLEKKAKWNAWESVKGTSKEDAMKAYIAEAEAQKKTFGIELP